MIPSIQQWGRDSLRRLVVKVMHDSPHLRPHLHPMQRQSELESFSVVLSMCLTFNSSWRTYCIIPEGEAMLGPALCQFTYLWVVLLFEGCDKVDRCTNRFIMNIKWGHSGGPPVFHICYAVTGLWNAWKMGTPVVFGASLKMQVQKRV